MLVPAIFVIIMAILISKFARQHGVSSTLPMIGSLGAFLLFAVVTMGLIKIRGTSDSAVMAGMLKGLLLYGVAAAVLVIIARAHIRAKAAVGTGEEQDLDPDVQELPSDMTEQPEAERLEPEQPESAGLVQRAISLVDQDVVYFNGGLRSTSGPPVQAAELLGQAADQAPGEPQLRYLEASAYAVGMQGETAQRKLSALLDAHPEHHPARVMQDTWKSIFHFPSYRLGDALPAAIDEQVTATLVVVTRDDTEVQPLLVTRQPRSNLQGSIGPSTRVAVHPLLVKTPAAPIVVVVTVIEDDPSDPLRVEALLMPFESTGGEPELEARVRFLLRARSLPVVVVDPDSNVLLARDVPISAARQAEMRGWEQELLAMTPRKVPQHEYIMAIQHYQSVTPMEQFGL